MFSETVVCYVGQLFGLSEKNKVLTFLGFAMGGVLLTLQAVIANKRAVAMEDAARAQTEAANAQGEAAEAQANAIGQQVLANQNTEEGQRQERLKNAIEHLGHQEVSVRLGGAYELFHLAHDTTHLRQTVLDILCAHIRQTTSEMKYRDVYTSKPSEEIQSLLNLLFVQNHRVFEGLHINLQEGWLNGADLSDARLQGAILSRASLEGADLNWARLQRATLLGVNFKKLTLKRHSYKGLTLTWHGYKALGLKVRVCKGLVLGGHSYKEQTSWMQNCKGRSYTKLHYRVQILNMQNCREPGLEIQISRRLI